MIQAKETCLWKKGERPGLFCVHREEEEEEDLFVFRVYALERTK